MPSSVILESIKRRASEDPHGLNGFLLFFHVGADPARRDKLHLRFRELVDWLADQRYELVRVDALLDGNLNGR